ncbi:MAG: UTP--glucose-1-phosphate uridylyltransferase [Bacteroidetes bacterium]|nr:UTP--glucose-1-phosphate uridylyltransferase [Bacteroidota bacterium]
MRGAGMHPLAITMFKRNYLQLLSGSTGSISRSQIEPVENVPDAEELSGFADEGMSALPHAVIIKLNGGLGTSMGLEQAKSLIPVKDGLRFIDVIAQQTLHLRTHFGTHVPLLLMNSFNTHDDSIDALTAWPELATELPPDFLQHRIPKVLVDDLTPAEAPDQPELEWCPPGHGDLYTAMVTSGLLEELLARGIRYAFVSNADNLGAVLDTEILGYFAKHGFPFMMEVADRTPADRKGGHLALLTDGRFTLREHAQCPKDEMDEFQDITLFRFFNTNNLWINLEALKQTLDRYDGILPLPLIRNSKTLDPRDPESPEVFQLETAMGAAISLFETASALRVPRTRFAPVKTTDDLLGIWSDAYVLTDDFRIVQNPSRTLPTIDVVLDRQHYKFISQLEEHFPHGAPSLLDCASLHIEGDAVFGKNVVCRGNVRIRVPDGETRSIPDNNVLEST